MLLPIIINRKTVYQMTTATKMDGIRLSKNKNKINHYSKAHLDECRFPAGIPESRVF